MMMMLVAAAAEEAEAWTDTDIDGQIMAAPCRAARSLTRSLARSFLRHRITLLAC